MKLTEEDRETLWGIVRRLERGFDARHCAEEIRQLLTVHPVADAAVAPINHIPDATKMVPADHIADARKLVAQPDERAAFERTLSVEDSFRQADGTYLNPHVQAVWTADHTVSDTAGMTLGERIAHVGARENAAGYIEFGSVMAVDALIQHVLRDARAASLQSGEKGEEYAAIVRDNPDDIGTLIEATRPLAVGTKLYIRAAEPRAALTDEQRRALGSAVAALERNGWTDPAAVVRALAQAPTERISDAARDVLAERARQVSEEGWTPAHDDEHASAALAAAAACYALLAAADVSDSADAWLQEWRKIALAIWPFDIEWLKPSTPRRNYVKAGALILAEIERIDRAGGEA